MMMGELGREMSWLNDRTMSPEALPVASSINATDIKVTFKERMDYY
jgi:hypothetical protein